MRVSPISTQLDLSSSVRQIDSSLSPRGTKDLSPVHQKYVEVWNSFAPFWKLEAPNLSTGPFTPIFSHAEPVFLPPPRGGTNSTCSSIRDSATEHWQEAWLRRSKQHSSVTYHEKGPCEPKRKSPTPNNSISWCVFAGFATKLHLEFLSLHLIRL